MGFTILVISLPFFSFFRFSILRNTRYTIYLYFIKRQNCFLFFFFFIISPNERISKRHFSLRLNIFINPPSYSRSFSIYINSENSLYRFNSSKKQVYFKITLLQCNLKLHYKKYFSRGEPFSKTFVKTNTSTFFTYFRKNIKLHENLQPADYCTKQTSAQAVTVQEFKFITN